MLHVLQFHPRPGSIQLGAREMGEEARQKKRRNKGARGTPRSHVTTLGRSRFAAWRGGLANESPFTAVLERASPPEEKREKGRGGGLGGWANGAVTGGNRSIDSLSRAE